MAILSNLLKTFGLAREVARSQSQQDFDLSKFVLLPTPTHTGKSIEGFGRISPQQLRKLSIIYWVARACINFRSSQISQLEWAIVGESDPPEELVNFFKHPENKNKRLRHFLDKVIDDLLTLDAVAVYKKRDRAGRIIGLLPVDAATIRVRVHEDGSLPEPPEFAYEQVINGRVVARLTQDDLIYDMLNPRSYSPYGLAPLESLLIQVASALRVDAYNLAFLQEGNVPEGFIFLPETVAKDADKIAQWQRWFDAFLAGDAKMMRRLRAMPGGAEYVATKKPSDMSFKDFQMWLLNATCAVFGVPPYLIGVTEQVYKVAGDAQKEISVDRGLRPLAGFFKEIFDNIIEEMGYKGFFWKWTTLDVRDRLLEAQIAERMIRIGAMTIDEWREREGLVKINSPHLVYSAHEPIKLADVAQSANDNEEVKQELTKWKRKALKDIESKGEVFREFHSNVIPEETKQRINALLKNCKNKDDVWRVFDSFIKNKQDYFQKIYEHCADWL